MGLPPRAELIEERYGKPLREICIDLCLERGTMSQPDIAEALGVTRQMLWMWQRIAGFSWQDVIAAVCAGGGEESSADA